MSFIQDSYALAAETLKKKFAKRNMDAFYCATKEEAKNRILSMIPEGSSVTWGERNLWKRPEYVKRFVQEIMNLSTENQQRLRKKQERFMEKSFVPIIFSPAQTPSLQTGSL